MTELGAYPALDSPADVAALGDRAYIAEDSGLQVIHVSNPASPIESGLLAAPEGYRRVVIVGESAIVAADDGVELVDLSRPDAPVRVEGLPIEAGGPIELVWDGRFALVRDALGVVHILQVTAGGGLSEVSSYDPPGGIWGGEVYGNEMFAKLGRARVMGLPTIALDDAHLYVADLDGGLRIVSLSAAGVPTGVERTMEDINPSNLVRFGNRLLVFSEAEEGTDWSWRVWQIDLSASPESAEIEELGTMRLTGQSDAASVCGYLSDLRSLMTHGRSAGAVPDGFSLGDVAGAHMGVANQEDTLYLLDPVRGLLIVLVEGMK